MAANGQALFYDISAIKEIPIITVAEQMGISVQKRGKNYWCKVRQEANPSVVLHPDRNSFYDFGNQAHGDVIRFVQYAQDITPGEAIRYLGKNFGLEPTMTRQALMDRPLTNWEYSKIGLHGDLATKNFVFPIDKLPLEHLQILEHNYKMSLNQLQKEHPKLFRDLIQFKAKSYVENLRNCYYLDILNHFYLVYAVGGNSVNLYRSKELRDRFQEDTAALNKAERILYRACRNAGLEAPEPQLWDPVQVLRELLRGNGTIRLGNIGDEDLTLEAQKQGCRICTFHVPYSSYFDDRLQSFLHAAVYKAGKVTVSYLSIDQRELAPVIKQLSSEEKSKPVVSQAQDRRKPQQKEFEYR